MRKGEPAMKAINNRDYSTLIAAATQKIPCDLTVKNVKLVNVLTGEIYPATVDVKDGVIVHVQPGEACDSQSKTTVDGQGKYLLPGFVEIHMHVESSMLTPERFGREAVLHGTTSAMTDPHEIGNVCGSLIWLLPAFPPTLNLKPCPSRSARRRWRSCWIRRASTALLK